jgi:hypothetical protein
MQCFMRSMRRALARVLSLYHGESLKQNCVLTSNRSPRRFEPLRSLRHRRRRRRRRQRRARSLTWTRTRALSPRRFAAAEPWPRLSRVSTGAPSLHCGLYLLTSSPFHASSASAGVTKVLCCACCSCFCSRQGDSQPQSRGQDRVAIEQVSVCSFLSFLIDIIVIHRVVVAVVLPRRFAAAEPCPRLDHV